MNPAQQAARQHRARLETRTNPTTVVVSPTPARLTPTTPGEPTGDTTQPIRASQPIPPSPHTHICVLCHLKGHNTPATWITDHTGYATCDNHRVLLENNGAAALQAIKNKHHL